MQRLRSQMEQMELSMKQTNEAATSQAHMMMSSTQSNNQNNHSMHTRSADLDSQLAASHDILRKEVKLRQETQRINVMLRTSIAEMAASHNRNAASGVRESVASAETAKTAQSLQQALDLMSS